MEKYFLHINEPCTQDWESMTTVAKGKFCNNCKKTVFDFTKATDGEIVKHVEAMKGETFCGQFEENQLDRWIERSDIKTTNPRLYKFLISFMLLGSVHNANAQTISAQEKVATQRRLDSLLNMESTRVETSIQDCDTIKEKVYIKDEKEKVTIRGRIMPISNNDQPLIVVDGIVLKKGAVSKLDPDKIKAISILKSPASQALFGSEAQNGVIIITSSYTKKQLRKMQ